MALALLIVTLLFVVPIVIANLLIFYKIMQIEGSDRKNTGIMIFGTYYSIYQLRLTYGFDFGIWMHNNYWYL